MTEQKKHLRFTVARRIEHWVNFLSFALLAMTGLPQKYPEAAISTSIFRLFGGIELTRVIHRASAIALMLVAIWHIGVALYKWLVQRAPLSMALGKEDATNAWKTIRYNLKLSDEKPKQGFYTFEEKVEYYALIWGTIVMIFTGFFLWNPLTTARVLPAAWIPVAKAAHGGEALLAVLAIILWHFYHVLVKHANKSMYTGTMSQHEMEEFHPAALEDDWQPPAKDDPAFKRREMFFYISYGIAGLMMLLGVFWFVTTENTAVAIPDAIQDMREVTNYSPVDPTPLPTLAVPADANVADVGETWNGGIDALMEEKCVLCHSENGKVAGLSLASYEGALAGGDSGPAVIPGQPGISLLMIWPEIEAHFGVFTANEAYALRLWIANGAPER